MTKTKIEQTSRLSKRLQKQTLSQVTQQQDVAMSDIIPSVEDSRPGFSVPSFIEAVDSEQAPEVPSLELNSNEPSDCIEELSVNGLQTVALLSVELMTAHPLLKCVLTKKLIQMMILSHGKRCYKSFVNSSGCIHWWRLNSMQRLLKQVL